MMRTFLKHLHQGFYSVSGKIIFLSACIAFLTALFISSLYYYQVVRITLEKETDKLAAQTRLLERQFRGVFSEMKNDTLVVSKTPPIQGIIRSIQNNGTDPLDGSTTQLWRERLETIFKSMIGPKNHYVQIRYIGLADGGRELVRVNRAGNKIEVVPPDALQQKENEPYFQAGLNLAPGAVYYSAVNLNREHGKIQKPYLPVIRTVMPVYDDSKTLFGMIVINAAYDQLLENTAHNFGLEQDVFIVDDKGNYLVYTKENKISGFKFAGFKQEYREGAPVIGALKKQTADEKTLFESIKGRDFIIHYFKLFFDPADRSRFLSLALTIPESELFEGAYEIRRYSFIFSVVLTITAAFVAASLARLFVRPLRRMNKEIRAYAEGKEILSLPVGGHDEIGEMARAFKDLTEKLNLKGQAERHLLVRLQSIMDNTLDGLITIDRDGTVKHYNKACRRIFGYAEEEVVGNNVKMLMPDPYKSEHDTYIQNYHETGTAKIIGIGREVSGKRKDGTVFPLDLAVSEIVLDGERFFSGIVRDITDRKKIEEENFQYMTSLERSNRELDNFAYIASHDLQEPLRMVTSFSKLLQEHCEDQLDEESEKYMNMVVSSAERMQELISDLLEYSRIEGEVTKFEETDCNEVMRIVRENLGEPIRETQADVTFDALPCVYTNPLRLTRLLQNLVENAIKYRKEGACPQVHVSATEDETEWVFCVRDNGIGMKEEYLEQIFTIFKRLHGKNKYHGTGIGLAVCKKIAESFGGRIWVESQVDKGSSFYFTMPLRDAMEEEDEENRAA